MRKTSMVGERCSIKDQADTALDNADQGEQSSYSSQSKDQYSQPSKQSVSSDDQTGAGNLEKEQPPMAYEERRCDRDISTLRRVEKSQESVLRSSYQLHLMITEQQAKRKLLMPKQEHWRKQTALAKAEGKETCPEQQSSGTNPLADYRAKLITLEQRRSQGESKFSAAERLLRVPNEGQEVDDHPVAEGRDQQSHSDLMAPTSLESSKCKRVRVEDMLCERSPVMGASSPKRMYRAGDSKIGQSDTGITKSPEGVPPTSQ